MEGDRAGRIGEIDLARTHLPLEGGPPGVRDKEASEAASHAPGHSDHARCVEREGIGRAISRADDRSHLHRVGKPRAEDEPSVGQHDHVGESDGGGTASDRGGSDVHVGVGIAELDRARVRKDRRRIQQHF